MHFVFRRGGHPRVLQALQVLQVPQRERGLLLQVLRKVLRGQVLLEQELRAMHAHRYTSDHCIRER